MNTPYALASATVFLLGITHSLIGERAIFRRLRAEKTPYVPRAQGGGILHERQVRILWATWHIATMLGWGLAAVLIWLAFASVGQGQTRLLGGAVAASLFTSALLVLIGTRGRHPGWIGFLGAAVLTLLGATTC